MERLEHTEISFISKQREEDSKLISRAPIRDVHAGFFSLKQIRDTTSGKIRNRVQALQFFKHLVLL